MQYASFVGFIKTIIYIIAIFYIVKFLVKLFLPVLLKKVVQKAGENIHKQQQYAQDNSWQKKTSTDEIIIDSAKVQKPREKKKVGEYVDYEELD